MPVGLPFLVVLVIVVLVLFLRQREPARRALILRRAGFVVMALSALVAGLWVAGEGFSDQGGWKALGSLSVWVVPLAVMAAIAWLRPGRSIGLFAFVTAGLIASSIWAAVGAEGWRGPIVVTTFVVATAVALLGLKRTAAAGVMLLVLGVGPPALTLVGNSYGVGPIDIGFTLAASPPS